MLNLFNLIIVLWLYENNILVLRKHTIEYMQSTLKYLFKSYREKDKAMWQSTN